MWENVELVLNVGKNVIDEKCGKLCGIGFKFGKNCNWWIVWENMDLVFNVGYYVIDENCG